MAKETENHLLSEVFEEYKESTRREFDIRFESLNHQLDSAEKRIWKELDNRKAREFALWLAVIAAGLGSLARFLERIA